jgi:hypothetical protein
MLSELPQKTYKNCNLARMQFVVYNLETLKFLAQLISAEIYLRTLVPEEYVFTDEFDNMEENFEKISNFKHKKILKLIKTYLRNEKDSQDILGLIP